MSHNLCALQGLEEKIFLTFPIVDMFVVVAARSFDLLFDRDLLRLLRLAFLTNGRTLFIIGRIAFIPTCAALKIT